jgi:hypothetical protein
MIYSLWEDITKKELMKWEKEKLIDLIFLQKRKLENLSK